MMERLFRRRKFGPYEILIYLGKLSLISVNVFKDSRPDFCPLQFFGRADSMPPSDKQVAGTLPWPQHDRLQEANSPHGSGQVVDCLGPEHPEPLRPNSDLADWNGSLRQFYILMAELVIPSARTPGARVRGGWGEVAVMSRTPATGPSSPTDEVQHLARRPPRPR